MNKLTKGALATGLGVALLVGGGGTLAVWNTSDKAEAGTIMSGNMTLTAGAGKWTNATDPKKERPLDLTAYRVVPGDVLTFTQPVTVGLEGDLLKATLRTTGLTSGNADFLEVGPPTLTKDGQRFPATLDQSSDGEYIATVNVTFPIETTELTNMNAENVLGKITFQLDQVTATE